MAGLQAPVETVMTRQVVLILRPRDSFRSAVESLADTGFRSLPVIDGAGRVAGMVSRNDLMIAVSGEVPV